MTLYRHLYRTTRPFVLASVAGSVLCSLTVTARAQQTLRPFPPVTLTPAYSTPVLLPARPSESIAPAVQPQAPPVQTPQLMPLNLRAEPLSATRQATSEMPNVMPIMADSGSPSRQAQEQMYLPVQYQARSEINEEPGILDRFRGVFRGGRKTAPVDPGMDYPKAPKITPPPQAPGVNLPAVEGNAGMPVIPTLPGAATSAAPGMLPATVTSSQPGLLRPPVGANPIHDLVPPSPAGSVDPVSVQTPNQTSVTPVAQSSLIPPAPSPEQMSSGELGVPPNPLASPGVQVAEVPAAPSQGAPVANLPRLDFNAPIPAPAKSIAPGEPSETGTNQFTPPAPESAHGAAMADAPTSASPAPGKPADPFADLFPGDAKAAPPAPSTNAPQKPYTGLTLDSEPAASPKMKTVDILPPPPTSAESADSSIPAMRLEPVKVEEPAPLKQQPVIPPTASEPPQETTVARTERKPEQIPELKAAPAAPAPQVASADSGNGIIIKPAPVKEKPAVSPEQQSKFARIAARQGQTGLKGFCPVVLRDQRDLVDSSDEFSVVYNGHTYEFCSLDAMQQFVSEPLKYAPASGCSDVIHLALTGERLEGSLDHAVWYKGRLYLFTSVETMETFVAAPSSHASNE